MASWAKGGGDGGGAGEQIQFISSVSIDKSHLKQLQNYKTSNIKVMPRILGSKKVQASYACFQQALENGTIFKINKRKTQVLSRTQLKSFFSHLSVRKAISNTDCTSILTVHLDVKQKKIELDVKPKIGKVQNIIVSRLKTVPGGCPWKYIKEETIRNSRSQVKKSQSQEVMNLRSKEVKYRTCYICNVICDKSVTIYENSIRRHLLKVHPVLCRLSKYDIDNVCPVVKIEF